MNKQYVKRLQKWLKVLLELFGGHTYVDFTFQCQSERQHPSTGLEIKSLNCSTNSHNSTHHNSSENRPENCLYDSKTGM